VTDATGNPVPNASIQVQNTQVGTVSREDGTFSLSVPANGRVLVISAVGMAAQEVTIGNQTSFAVTMRDAAQQNLQEVVISSLGVRRDKKTLGYSAPTIGGEDLTTARQANITNALAAKVSGVRVEGSGGAFTGSRVLIRGNTSVTGVSAPLYVVDGVPIDNSGGGTALQTGTTTTNRAVDLNPEDIESMTVLKGAAATSQYGSRGAGGVILITTKKGRRRAKNSIEVNSSYNISEVNRLPDFQNTYAQGAGGVYNPNVSTSWGPEITGQTVTNFFGQQEQLKAHPNNVSDLFKTGQNFQNNISFNGGSDRTSYRVSYGNTGETFVVASNRLDRNNVSFNLNSDVTSRLTISSYLNYTNTTSKRTQQGNQLSNPFFRSWFTPRSYDLTNAPYYDANGNQWFFGGEDNPYWSIENIRYNDEVNRVFGNLGLRYRFTDWLNADLKVGADFYNFYAHGFDEIGARGGGNTNAGGLGGIIDTRNNNRNLNSYFTVNANRKYGDFGITASVGNEVTENKIQNAQMIGRTLTVKGFDQMSNASVYAPTTGFSKRRIVGVFGDLVIDYRNWVTVNVKARNDFVSTLSPENNSVFYPAAAITVNPFEIFPELKGTVVDNVKLRANMGKVGNSPGPYNTSNYQATANPSDGFGPNIQFPFNGQLGFTISNAAGNPELQPEFTKEWEIGTEMSFFKGRITLEANHYQRKLTGGLFSVPYSAASGITSVFQNAGELKTDGNEISLGLVPLKTMSGFVWSIHANYTQFKTIVETLAPGVANIFLGGFTTPNIRLVAGDEYGQIYGTKYRRDAQGRLLLTAGGLPLATTSVEKIGNPNPKFTLGINNSLSYKGFDLTVLLDIRKGGDMYSRNLADLRRNGVVAETAEFARFDKNGVANKPYQFQGVDASGNAINVPVTVEQYWGNSGVYVAAEGYIVNTSWTRVREAALTYSLPRSFTDKTPFGNIELGVFGRNLFLWTKDFKHLDPEQNVLGISPAQGLEYNAQPSTRTIGVNLRITL
jgi:TonB-linked SusC/RagA family outer membrane protein